MAASAATRHRSLALRHALCATEMSSCAIAALAVILLHGIRNAAHSPKMKEHRMNQVDLTKLLSLKGSVAATAPKIGEPPSSPAR